MLKKLLNTIKTKLRLSKKIYLLLAITFIAGLSSLSLHSTAATKTNHRLSTTIKNTLMTSVENNPLAHNTRDPLNVIIQASSDTASPSNNLPNSLSQQSPSSNPTPATIDFPPELPSTVNNLDTDVTTDNTTENLNTPEYVIIRSSDQVTFSSETTAQVTLLPIKEGSSFKKNDILLELDCREQQAELNKSKAEQRASNEAVISANKLKSYGSISEYELIKAQSEADMINADVDRLSAIVDKCTIRAPFNGSIAELMVHAHETVKPGDPLLKIVNTENLELQMQIPSSWLRWIHIGTTFTVHVSEIDKSIDAAVTKINPQIDSVSQTVKITGTIVQHDNDLLPGMSGQALFPDNPDKNTMKSKE